MKESNARERGDDDQGLLCQDMERLTFINRALVLLTVMIITARSILRKLPKNVRKDVYPKNCDHIRENGHVHSFRDVLA